MRTVATFGWLNVSLKLPLTTWVNHYVDYFRHEWRPQQRLDWLAAGHEYFWYLACSIVGLSIIIYFEILALESWRIQQEHIEKQRAGS